jgi:hypothetical protein
MPVQINRGSEGYVTVPLRRAEIGEDLPEQGWWSQLGDAFAVESYAAQIKDSVEQILVRNANPREPGFDPLQYVPEGYEDYADAYAWAYNRAEVDKITANIDETNAARRRRNEVGLGRSLAQSLIVGMVDPVNFVAGPTLRGAGFIGGMLKGGAAAGTLNLGTELVRHRLDPTSSMEETVFNIGAGYFAAGLIGGAIGKFAKPLGEADGSVRIEGGRVNIPAKDQARLDAKGNDFEKAMRAADGYVTNEVISFEGVGVKVVVGPTGKTDVNGNPVSAFFRKKETFEAIDRAATVSRAADSMLGDIVLDAPEVTMDVLEELQGAGDDLIREAGEQLDEADVALPVGGNTAAEPGAARAAGAADEPAEDTIFIDVDGLKARYADKPWTQSRVEGVIPLADDAIKSPAEWVNFVFLHELHHVRNPRITEGPKAETKADYENRINTLALEEVRAGRLPLAPSDSYLEKLAIAPMPLAQLQRLVGNDEMVFRITLALAGDFETLNIANRAYKASTPGGSAYLRSNRWMADFFEAHTAIRQGYTKYIRGYAADSNMVTNIENLKASTPVIGAAAQQGKMPLEEFAQFVGRATFDDNMFSIGSRSITEGEMAIVREAATKQREFYLKFEKAAKEQNMFDGQKRAEWEINWRQEKIDEIKARMATEEPLTDGQRETWLGLINEWDSELDRLTRILNDQEGIDPAGDLEAGIRKRKRNIRNAQGVLADGDMPRPKTEGQLDSLKSRLNEMDFKLNAAREKLGRLTDTPFKHPGDDGYFHRVYNVGKIKDKFEDFVKLIGFGYAREAGNEANVTPEILARARKTANNIIGEGAEEGTYGIGGPRALSSRAIPLSNKELADFIILDAEMAAGTYARRMGPAIEMQRMFGSQTMDKQIAELRLHMTEKGIPKAKQDDAIWIIEVQRDRVLNRLHAKDPLSLDNRGARAMMMYGNTTTLGNGIFAQTTELFRTMATVGYAPLWKTFTAAFDEGFKKLEVGKWGRVGGEALDIATMRLMAGSMEDDSAVLATRTTMAERGLQKAQPWFFMTNLMAPFNVLVKDWSSTMVAHVLIEDSKIIADALRAGRTAASLTPAESKIAMRLASFGINPRGAQLLADMPVDQTKGGLYLPKADMWEGKAGEAAYDLFIGAVQGYTRSNVITPGPLQRPAIMDGVIQVKKDGLVSRTLGNGSDRLELPLLAPMFQLLSFPITSGAKITHSLLSGRERSTMATTAALIAGAYLGARLRMGENWDYMSWEEKTYTVIDRSGVTAYAMDPAKRIEELTGYGPRSAMGLDPIGNPDAIAPKIGAIAGPAAGVMAGVAEGLISDDLTSNQRADGVRRGIAFSGMLWWDEWMKEASRAVASSGAFVFEPDSNAYEPDEEEPIEMMPEG